jgi:hypothetical protein
MTITMERAGLWETRPGWGIAVDLTPIEVVNTRKVRSLKKMIVALLGLVLVLCFGATAKTILDKVDAQDSYDAAQASTATLQSQATQYEDVTAMQTTIAQLGAQVSTLMANDVDFVNLMARIRTALPPGVTIDNESVALALQPAAAAADAATDPAATAAADPAAPGAIIGTVTLSGSGTAIKDLSAFVANLIRLKGVVDVVPTSTTKTESGMDYSLSLNVTDTNYTHRFDPGAVQ